MVNYEEMGKRIKMKRRSKRLSQAQVANAVRISPSYYGNIERGNRIPSIDTLVAIANVLEVGTDFLLADSVHSAVPQHTKEEMRLLTRYLRDRVAELDYSGYEPEDLQESNEE